MQHAGTIADAAARANATVPDASDIPALGHAEAVEMARAELDQFIQLLESLDPEDWRKPTACTLWDVRQMVAHVAATAAGLAQRSEFARQGSAGAQRPYRKQGMDKLEAMNQLGVDDRAHRTPAELIGELRECAPRAIAFRRRLPGPLRALPLPLGLAFPFGKVWVCLGYLTDLIMTRDMWIHRLDVCRATDRQMVLAPEHDGRMTALVMRDLASRLTSKLDGRSVSYELSGPAGGSWRVGRAPEPAATIRMDALDFHWLAAARATAEEIRENGLVSFDGDGELANRALDLTWVTY